MDTCVYLRNKRIFTIHLIVHSRALTLTAVLWRLSRSHLQGFPLNESLLWILLFPLPAATASIISA